MHILRFIQSFMHYDYKITMIKYTKIFEEKSNMTGSIKGKRFGGIR